MRFFIFIGILLVMFFYKIENGDPTTKPIKRDWYEHVEGTPVWQNPDNIKQIKKKYKL
jgi:hypothetical protein